MWLTSTSRNQAKLSQPLKYEFHLSLPNQPIHTGVTISTELILQIYGNRFSLDVKYCILGDPGATSWDDAIFSG